MSHGTKPRERAPSSKIGRNTRKCQRYRERGIRDLNKTRRIAKNNTPKEKANA